MSEPKCPAQDVKKWAKFLAGILVIAAPQIPGVGPIIAQNPDIAVSLVGALMALVTGEAPAAATRQVARRVKEMKNGHSSEGK